VIFVFPTRGNTDWNQVRKQRESVGESPHPVYTDDRRRQYVLHLMATAWVHPGPKGWASDGSEWAVIPCELYKRCNQRTPIDSVGTIWPGFDDTEHRGA